MKKYSLLPSILALVMAALLAGSCGEGLLTNMNRTLADPVLEVPVVTSFVYENRIDVSWSSDPGADIYVLERALDAASPAYSVVYQGTRLCYSDADCADQVRYLYRLTKVRGNKSFGPSDAALGVASSVCQDAQEPDDCDAQAAFLQSTLAANLFYYTTVFQQHNAPLVSQDADWYSVEVPANSTANIVVTQIQPELGAGETNAWMYFYLKGQFEDEIRNSLPIAVTNYSNVKAQFLFKIRPVPSRFPANGGGSLVDFTVKLYSITGN